MNYEYEIIPNNKKKLKNERDVISPCYGSLYTITHLIVSFFAIYLSWKCNKGQFSLTSFTMALLCPHLYIIYSLAMSGGCGLFESPSVSTIPLLPTLKP